MVAGEFGQNQVNPCQLVPCQLGQRLTQTKPKSDLGQLNQNPTQPKIGGASMQRNPEFGNTAK